MKIGIISQHDCNDKKALSGTLFMIKESLIAAGNETIWIRVKIGRLYRFYSKLCSLLGRLTSTKVIPSKTTIGAWLYGWGVNENSIMESVDVILAPFQSVALRFLKTNKRIVYVSDATFSLLNGYYSEKVAHWNEIQGNKIEQIALNKASFVVLSSDWAAVSAMNDYGQNPSKIRVLEFGPNIDVDAVLVASRIYDGHLNVLFSGVDWKRKGGDLAVKTCKCLIEKGVDVTLHILGIRDLEENVKNLPFVKWHGFLNKNDAKQNEKYLKILSECHCLLLPTIAECSAIVYSEATALGMPIFTHETGGTSNYVLNGVNGYRLPLGSTASDFADKIFQTLTVDGIGEMSERCLDLYRKRMNWKRWGEEVTLLFEK